MFLDITEYFRVIKSTLVTFNVSLTRFFMFSKMEQVRSFFCNGSTSLLCLLRINYATDKQVAVAATMDFHSVSLWIVLRMPPFQVV